ncbi:MAG: ECF-type sigma factor [Vulcanibacillus sp.]
MNQEQATNILIKNYHILKKRILKQIKSMDENGYKGNKNITDKLELYENEMDECLLNRDRVTNLFNWKMNDKINYFSDSQVMDDWLTGYYANIHRFVFLASLKKYKERLSYDSYTDLSDSQQYNYDNTIDPVETDDINKTLDSLYRLFSVNYLDATDTIIFNLKLKETNNDEIADKLNISVRTVLRHYEFIRYRLSVFLCLHIDELIPYGYSLTDIIKQINQIDNKSFNVRYFNSNLISFNRDSFLKVLKETKHYTKSFDNKKTDNIFTIRLDELTNLVSTHNEHKPYRSKYDMDGKKHEKYVLYVLKNEGSMVAYCHVTKKTVRIETDID